MIDLDFWVEQLFGTPDLRARPSAFLPLDIEGDDTSETAMWDRVVSVAPTSENFLAQLALAHPAVRCSVLRRRETTEHVVVLQFLMPGATLDTAFREEGVPTWYLLFLDPPAAPGYPSTPRGGFCDHQHVTTTGDTPPRVEMELATFILEQGKEVFDSVPEGEPFPVGYESAALAYQLLDAIDLFCWTHNIFSRKELSPCP